MPVALSFCFAADVVCACCLQCGGKSACPFSSCSDAPWAVRLGLNKVPAPAAACLTSPIRWQQHYAQAIDVLLAAIAYSNCSTDQPVNVVEVSNSTVLSAATT
jgi:hypothetical protein